MTTILVLLLFSVSARCDLLQKENSAPQFSVQVLQYQNAGEGLENPSLDGKTDMVNGEKVYVVNARSVEDPEMPRPNSAARQPAGRRIGEEEEEDSVWGESVAVEHRLEQRPGEWGPASSHRPANPGHRQPVRTGDVGQAYPFVKPIKYEPASSGSIGRDSPAAALNSESRLQTSVRAPARPEGYPPLPQQPPQKTAVNRRPLKEPLPRQLSPSDRGIRRLDNGGGTGHWHQHKAAGSGETSGPRHEAVHGALPQMETGASTNFFSFLIPDFLKPNRARGRRKSYEKKKKNFGIFNFGGGQEARNIEEHEPETLVQLGDWAAQWDDAEQDWYFYNYETQESTWEKPYELSEYKFDNPYKVRGSPVRSKTPNRRQGFEGGPMALASNQFVDGVKNFIMINAAGWAGLGALALGNSLGKKRRKRSEASEGQDNSSNLEERLEQRYERIIEKLADKQDSQRSS